MMMESKASQYNRGSTLAWVAIVMVVLLIIVGAILSLATFFHQKSVNSNSRSQSYYTAQSGINTVVSALNTKPKGTLATNLKALPSLTAYKGDASLKTSEYLNLGNLSFDANTKMGSCNLKLYHIGGRYYIKAVGSIGKQESVVAAELGLKQEKDNPLPVWNDFVYGAGLSAKEWRNASVINTSLFIDSDGTKDVLKLWSNGKNLLEIEKNLYSHRIIDLPNSSAGCFIGGMVVTDQVFTAAGSYTIKGGFSSSAAVTLKGSGVVGDSDKKSGGNISATDVTITDTVNVYGDVIANKVNLSGSSVITGNVVADTLTMSGKATISGNVTAKKITITGDATIGGNVTAETIQIDTVDYKKDTKHIAGTTTSKYVYFNSSLISRLDMKYIFYGDLTLEVLQTRLGSYDSPYDAFFPSWFMDVGCKSNYYFNQVSYKNVIALEAPVFPEVKSPTGLPAEVPADVTVNKITDDDVKANRVNVEMGGENDTYYELSLTKKTVSFNITSLKGEGNVYLFVKNGTVLNLNTIVYDKSFTKTLPNFFIVGEPGSTIDLSLTTAEGFYGYIWGRKNGTLSSTINIDSNIKGGIFSEGNLTVGKGTGNAGYILTYIPLSNGIGGGGEGISGKEFWYVKQYYNDIPSPEEVNG